MARVKRPQRVRIGPFVYRVKWRREVRDSADETILLSGRADHFALDILICSTLDEIVQRKTLLHEVLHACNWITGHDEETNEERFVRAIAFPLLDVLRDNPRLVEWMTA